MSGYGIALTVLLLSMMLIVYHHIGYPLLLHVFAKHKRSTRTQVPATLSKASRLPSITIIVPAHNEEAVIAHKIANLAALDYPEHLLRIIIALDGCTDKTHAIAQAALVHLPGKVDIHTVKYPRRMGKIAVLNEQIATAQTDIVGLSDASIMIEPAALRKAASHFTSNDVGVVCAIYKLLSARNEGERAYWEYQTRIMEDEAALAAPMGAHRPFYLFRRALWSPMPPDTINDDFELPMRIVQKGYRAIYDCNIVATELETSLHAQEFWRRVRIGAGNMQQAIRFASLSDPRRGWLAFLFLSGKGLRAIMPFLFVLFFSALLVLAGQESAQLFRFLLVTLLLLVAMAIAAVFKTLPSRLGAVVQLGYAFEGYTASLLGALSYLTGRTITGWQPASSAHGERHSAWQVGFIPRNVAVCKRGTDIVLALLALCALVVLFIPIALAIRLTSPGPVFHRQLRVGRMTPEATYLFALIKFRSMRAEAETGTGPVWAKKNDPRITKVGAFLRKSRLDELPQCLNVLKGEMSVVGPRPERPAFFRSLEDSIPFYTDRTFGLRPGITGLAQINQGYDSNIEDVRNKVTFDHAYAIRLGSWWSWIQTDLGICLKTVSVMLRSEGR